MGGRPTAALLAVLVLLAACRPGSPAPDATPSPTPPAPAPSPTTGLRVAVVLPPASLHAAAELAAVRDDLTALQRRHGDDLASLRIVQPDEPSFVADVTTLVAERGADLVCVLGAGSGPVVLEVAPSFPTTEFCATPAAGEPADIPPNALLVDVRVEELAYLAGVAAQLVGQPRAPGFIAGEGEFAVDRQRAAFVAGMNAVAEEPVTPYVGFPAGDEARAHEFAAAQYAAGVAAIYVAGGPADAGVRRAAEEAGRLVIGSRRTLAGEDGELPPVVLLTTDVDLMVPLELALQRALESWEGGRATVGLAEDALVVEPGPSPRYRAVAATVQDHLARIRAGELRPLPAG